MAMEADNDRKHTRGRRIRPRGEDVRRFILEHAEKSGNNVAAETAGHFRITRQAVSEHIHKLVTEGVLVPSGNTRNRSYKLAPLVEWTRAYRLGASLEEDRIWSLDVAPILGRVPENALGIWQYCFTEMFNNAIDHSGGSEILCSVGKTALTTQILLSDNGIGIFRKIQRQMGLLDERHAILELSKGKLTTDPGRHTGQGIFFTSRLLDSFDILSGGAYFTHRFGAEDWILETPEVEFGTAIFMKLNNHTSRTAKKIFEQFSEDDSMDFTKTIVPVKLARLGNDQLVSRSQAKRVLARVDLFKTVVFDFADIDAIGHSFADEIFRVFALGHTEISLLAINTSPSVKAAINAAVTQRGRDSQTRMLFDA